VYQNLWEDVIFTPPAGDRFRRIILSSTAMCRNTGLLDPL
jgi:hypothetical protein